MIIVQDRIVATAARLPAIDRLFRERYRGAAGERGLQWLSSEVSPPVNIDEAPLTLWVRWRLADAGAFWAMRAQSGTPEIAAFWAEVDQYCQSRERTYLQDAASDLPAPTLTTDAPVNTRGYRVTAQLTVNAGAQGAREALARRLTKVAANLPGLELGTLAPNLAPEYAAGHFTWDLLFPDAATAAKAWDSDGWREQAAPCLAEHCGAVHALALETIGGGLREPDIAGGIKRTALFRLLPHSDADTARRFEQDLLAMPRHIAEIRNWRLSRARPVAWHRADVAPWSYVWEQEFATLDGLTGPYMAHPHHWSHIDRWFDPESGIQAIDAGLSHAFGPFDHSLLARELSAARD
ncbi:Dabb family protein [Parahaliea mediterranea]|uniref:Dabb family protein n=1 Tax=Parahaliea mediterranea TaxID=651086 RepID=A0A939DG33_9GAMM|nr:Dabb family protein [Parahaliea mediterranea]MBN7797660.1 Dabb family protein [Parahaliea mediterranea]